MADIYDSESRLAVDIRESNRGLSNLIHMSSYWLIQSIENRIKYVLVSLAIVAKEIQYLNKAFVGCIEC